MRAVRSLKQNEVSNKNEGIAFKVLKDLPGRRRRHLAKLFVMQHELLRQEWNDARSALINEEHQSFIKIKNVFKVIHLFMQSWERSRLFFADQEHQAFAKIKNDFDTQLFLAQLLIAERSQDSVLTAADSQELLPAAAESQELPVVVEEQQAFIKLKSAFEEELLLALESHPKVKRQSNNYRLDLWAVRNAGFNKEGEWSQQAAEAYDVIFKSKP